MAWDEKIQVDVAAVGSLLSIFVDWRFNKISLLAIYIYIYIINIINYSVSFPRHPWIFLGCWIHKTVRFQAPGHASHKHWFHLSLHILPFASFHTDFTSISSDMTCLQSKAFAETQCHQLITSFALRKVACTNRICKTSVVQHKMPGRNLHMKRITQPLFLPIIKGSLLGIAWLVDTFHQKKTPEIRWSISSIFLLCSYHLHINPSQDPRNLPRPKTNMTKKHIHHLKMYRSMSHWKMAMFLPIANPPGVSINSPGNLLGEFHQGSTPPWVPSSIHSLDQRLPPLTTTKIGTNLEKPHRTNPTSMLLCIVLKLFLYCVYIYMRL